MADYNVLKSAIADYVKDRTGIDTIDGDGLQETLMAMVNSLGANYQFAGVAKLTPTQTDPGTPDQNVFYIAAEPGTYTNFPISGGYLQVAENEVAIFKYNGQWSKETTGAATAAQVNQLGQNKSAGTGTTAYNLIHTNIKSGEKVIYKIDIPSGTSRVFLFYNGNGSNRIADTAGTPTIVSGQEVEWTAVADIISFGLFVSGAPSDVTLTIKYGLFLPAPAIADNIVSAAKIQDGAVTSAKIANNAVSRSKILENAVGASQIGDSEVIAAKLGDFINLNKKSLPITIENLAIVSSKNVVAKTYQGVFFNGVYLQSNASYDVVLCLVEKSKTYICNTNIRFLHFVSEDGVVQSATQTNNVFTTLSDTAFAIVSVYATQDKEYQVEIGSTSTTYEAFKPIIRDEYLPERRKVYIKTTDTQFEILEKMLYAFNLGDCDVIWEKGTYTFDDVYVYMRYTLGWSWTMELPIGKGCRYYFNGSTLIANYPDDTYRQEHYPWANPYDQPVNILGVKAGAMGNTDFEIHDVNLINNGGTYCVHDECVNEATGYNHVYDNCIMKYVQGATTESLSKCIGGGAGRNGFIVIKNCVFVNGNPNTSAEDVSWHGIQSPSDPSDVSKLTFLIDGCYFSRKFRIGGSFKTGDENVLKYSNNSHDEAPSVEYIEASYIFNNELR